MADRFNEEGVAGFTLPGTTARDEQGVYGNFGSGMGPVGTAEGRLGGGGWADSPMSYSAEHGYGIWAESPAADDEEYCGPVRADQEGTDVILKTVQGWDAAYMQPRLNFGP